MPSETGGRMFSYLLVKDLRTPPSLVRWACEMPFDTAEKQGSTDRPRHGHQLQTHALFIGQ